jgi:hypothetical protein
MVRWTFAFLAVGSLAAGIAVGWLCGPAAGTAHALLIAPPGGRCVLVRLQRGWVNVSGLLDSSGGRMATCWTHRGVGRWSATTTGGGPRRTQVGPFLFWQQHSVSRFANVRLVRGTLAVPTDDRGNFFGPGDRYASAGVTWQAIPPGTPGWLALRGWDVRLPSTLVCAVTAILPLVVGGTSLVRLRHRRRSMKESRCVNCGYDLRASPQRCPECGRAVVAVVASGAAPTAPAGTAPAGAERSPPPAGRPGRR